MSFKKIFYFCLISIFFSSNIYILAKSKNKIEQPVIIGDWVHIFNPNDTRSEIDTTWYTNDHCFAKDAKGNWHAYGIIGHKPINPWKGENKFFHISTSEFAKAKWNDHDYALRTKKGAERVLWAPHVYHEKEDDTWYMFYNIGNLQENAPSFASWGQLCRADSKDLFKWDRKIESPLFSDPGHARDAFIFKEDSKYYFYYTRTYNEVDMRSCIAVRTGPDLDHWSAPSIVHIQEAYSNCAGDAESPFIVKRGDLYYLFVCIAGTSYNETHVYWSESLTDFPKENLVCKLPTHASEVIEVDGKWYISNTGWDKKGLFIAEIKWEKSR